MELPDDVREVIAGQRVDIVKAGELCPLVQLAEEAVQVGPLRVPSAEAQEQDRQRRAPGTATGGG